MDIEEKQAIEMMKFYQEEYRKQIKTLKGNGEPEGYGTIIDTIKGRICNIQLVLNLIEKQQAELEKKDKRISDLEFALMDMVLQFADENKDKIGTMGLSALEIAFNELDFDNPMPIKEVHKRYKELAQEYYKVEREGK